MLNQTKSQLPSIIEEHKKFFSETLPLEFLIGCDSIEDDDKLDFLILDEAQDLITLNYLEVFDTLLKGGLRNGNWIMFGDFSNQAIYSVDALKIFFG